MQKITLSLLLATALFSNEFESEFTQEKSIDHLESYNRIMTSFNDGFYSYVFTPLTDGYQFIMPETGRTCISNFFDNLLFPVRLLNNLLQFKLLNSFEETERFIINSTLGFAGIIDIAGSYYDIKPHREDLGQTLGFYGIGSGNYLVLPFLGPSSFRDVVGLTGDHFSSPLTYVDNYGYTTLETINNGVDQMKNYESFTKDALDKYSLLKSMYEMRREKQIKE